MEVRQGGFGLLIHCHRDSRSSNSCFVDDSIVCWYLVTKLVHPADSSETIQLAIVDSGSLVTLIFWDHFKMYVLFKMPYI